MWLLLLPDQGVQLRGAAPSKTGSGTELIQHMTSPIVLSQGHCNSIISRPPPNPTTTTTAAIHPSGATVRLPCPFIRRVRQDLFCRNPFDWPRSEVLIFASRGESGFAQDQCEADLAEKLSCYTCLFLLGLWRGCLYSLTLCKCDGAKSNQGWSGGT